jgi:hypothetical protein
LHFCFQFNWCRITPHSGTTLRIQTSPHTDLALDDRYHQANVNVATIMGITTTSMIAVELIFRSKRLKCARLVVNKEPLCTEIKGLAVDQV